MTFLPTCHPDNRPARYVPGTGYVCDPNARTGWAPVPMVGSVPWFQLVDQGWLMRQTGGEGAPVTSVPASTLNELVKRGWCRGAGGQARCPWLIQELGAIDPGAVPSTTSTLLKGIVLGVVGTFLVASIKYERIWK